jgi:hypothetical protein
MLLPSFFFRQKNDSQRYNYIFNQQHHSKKIFLEHSLSLKKNLICTVL